MAQRTGSGPAADTSFGGVWQVPDARVASGRIPGYAGAVRIGGHLLTMTCGWGAVLEKSPLQTAMLERGVFPGPLTPPMSGDDVEAAEPWMAPGRWGWDGGTGTTAHVDPTRGTVGVLLTQRAMTGPLDGFGDFWTAVAAAT
jgi:CubicO group peptidase (beta-lactamase class C family)